MARNIQVVVTCDIDENDDTDGLETVRFGFEGGDYEIDLCADHLEEFNESIRPYVDMARKAENGKATTRRRRRQESSTPQAKPRQRSAKAELTSVREWARAHGYKVSDRGRISQEVRDAYASAHQ
ncbi:MAG TPA: Lsr2 family protein [Acidimicrobiales bacterium]|nr:Lsr2 family protein [Acidimicrobiales bacterium]